MGGRPAFGDFFNMEMWENHRPSGPVAQKGSFVPAGLLY
jgi:hypothetical protein